MPGSAPIAPKPLAGPSILNKGKIHAGTQEYILSGASLDCVMELTALLVWLLWFQVFDLGEKKKKSVPFISVCDCRALGKQSCAAMEGAVVAAIGVLPSALIHCYPIAGESQNLPALRSARSLLSCSLCSKITSPGCCESD